MLFDGSVAKKFDISVLVRSFPHIFGGLDLLNLDFTHYYRTLAYVSTFYNGATLFEIGTRHGAGAVCLGFNDENKVISYDIEDFTRGLKKGNVEFRIGNVISGEPLSDEILSSPLIFLDVEPHDGLKEDHFVNLLIAGGFKGVLLLDDVGAVHYPGIVAWWAQFEHCGKVDLKVCNPLHGFGVVDFNQNWEFVNVDY